MSTRSTILYCNPIHIYDELLDDSVYLEYETRGLTFNVRLTKSDEFPGDLRELLSNWSKGRELRDAEQNVHETGGRDAVTRKKSVRIDWQR